MRDIGGYYERLYEAKVKQHNGYIKAHNDLVNTRDSSLLDYKPPYIGMEMHHKYRAKNAMGAYIIQNETYLFDDQIIEIISIESDNRYDDIINALKDFGDPAN